MPRAAWARCFAAGRLGEMEGLGEIDGPGYPPLLAVGEGVGPHCVKMPHTGGKYTPATFSVPSAARNATIPAMAIAVAFRRRLILLRRLNRLAPGCRTILAPSRGTRSVAHYWGRRTALAARSSSRRFRPEQPRALAWALSPSDHVAVDDDASCG